MPFAELDNLYSNVLSACPTSQLPLVKRVLPFLQLYAKVSTTEVFLGLPPGQLNLTLRGLRSIVDVDVGGRLRSFHASFFDFLFDPSRAKDYYVDIEPWYASNFHRLFSLVTRSMPVLEPDGVEWTVCGHRVRCNPQEIETCIMECSRQGSKIKSLQTVIADSLQNGSWSQILNGSFEGSFRFAAALLVRMINVLQVCHVNLRYCDLTSTGSSVHATRQALTCRPRATIPIRHTRWISPLGMTKNCWAS